MIPRDGAELACRALVSEGVRVAFGHPGGAILPFYDALYRTGAPRHVLCRHEQAAAHAADGYARATGRTGVCVATSGPGATNLVTGLATALMDSVPLVAVTGQVARPVLGTQAFQETDIVGVTMPVTKHGFLVQDARDVPRVLAEAFRLARSGRPGPVLVDLPKDVQAQVVAGEPASPPRVGPARRVTAPGVEDADAAAGRTPAPGGVDLEPVERAAAWIAEARRPVLLVGRGVVLSGTSAAVRALAERADLPVVTTLLALDAFPATDPRSLGMPGMHGTERANRAVQAADLVVGLGVRFDDRVTGPPERFAPGARVVHFEVEGGAVGRTIRPHLAVVADLARSLPALVERARPARRPEWWLELREWSRHAGAPDAPWGPTGAGLEPEARFRAGPLGAREAVRAVARRISAAGALVASDVGQHQMWLAQELSDLEPGGHLTSGGLGTMGYALPAAIGAAVGRPDRPVWVVAGDGGFQMNLQELATVVQERLPLRIAVVDNGHLGMVRQWQSHFYGDRRSASRLSGPDLVAMGQAYGIPAWRVDRSERIEPALDLAAAVEGPVLLWLEVEPAEDVYPMVPAGAALDEMILEPAPVAG